MKADLFLDNLSHTEMNRGPVFRIRHTSVLREWLLRVRRVRVSAPLRWWGTRAG